jgi:hypothetical protein
MWSGAKVLEPGGEDVGEQGRAAAVGVEVGVEDRDLRACRSRGQRGEELSQLAS